MVSPVIKVFHFANENVCWVVDYVFLPFSSFYYPKIMVRFLTIAATFVLVAITQAKNLNDVDPKTVTSFKDGAL